MKKQVALVLTVLILFNLTGCLKRGDKGKIALQPTQRAEVSSSATASDENVGTPNSSAADTDAPAATPIAPTEKPEEKPVFSEEVRISSKVHTQISPENYYQKSFLSATEKKIYEKLADAAMQGRTSIPVKAYRCSGERMNYIFYALKADYPQFFYLSGYYNCTVDYSSNTVKDVFLAYFDGTVTDEYDSKSKLTKAADRELIGRQIKEFNSKVSEIVDKIPADISDFDKEKMIYEYIQDSITFDEVSNDSPPASYSEIKNHSFDSFGAACEGKSVCEGYAELFQYLCYCVGIDATIVRGKTTRANHMWNAICLDSEWYMVDPTWDDVGMDGLHCYGYFNVTEDYIKSIGRTINDEELNVPSCTATKYAFYNMCGLYVEKADAVPANYKVIIDRAALNCEKFICVYFADKEIDFEKYCAQFILSPNSEIYKYIQSNNYKLKISGTYYTVEDAYYLKVE